MTEPLYDHEAQHRRDVALHNFLDLGLDHWHAWLADIQDDKVPIPRELEPYAASVIVALKQDVTDNEARGDYLQAVASMDTSVLEYFARVVGAYKSD